MNKEAGQIQESKRRHKYRDDLDPENLDWLVWLSHSWKWYIAVNQISALDSTMASPNIKRKGRIGKPRSIHS